MTRPREHRQRWGLGLAVVALTALVALVVWAAVAAVTGSDDATLGPLDASVRASPSPDVVQDILGDDESRPSTLAPLDPERAAQALVAQEVIAFTDRDGLTQVVVLARNADTVAYANLAGVADLLGPAGTTLTTLDFVVSAIDAGQIAPITGAVEAPPEAVLEVRLDYAARGTVETGSGAVAFADVTFDQAPTTGSVTVRGRAQSVSELEFVGLVALLRNADGTVVGTASGFLPTVTAEGVAFEALGFPTGDVASVEVYAAP